ncbi:MAG: NfeD family protein [Actinomycetota bacterium]|nr:NfeD family protein [Actinomycetota bacterium]MDQ3721023.1 NfeD family protein [Actinomycetota bacterium]
MEEWVVWMAAAGLLAVGEIFTMGFFLAPIAIAAGVAGVAALLGAGLAVQLVVFILASAASVGLLRPVARRHLHTPARIRTGTAALVGRAATVIDRVDGHGGSVKLAGEVWSARAFDEDHAFEPGQRVEVLEIEGATALVHE